MPGRSSPSGPLQYLGAVVAVVGYAVFGWRFGETESAIPLVVGGLCAAVVIGWTLYQRLYATG